jgi:polysaccharide pyruvyl transferase WcaK-like protein
MRDSVGPARIGILGHVGNGNLGDEASFAAVGQNIQKRCPSVEVYGITLNPRDTRVRHNLPALPIRRIPSASASTGLVREKDSPDSPGPTLNRWYRGLFLQLKRQRVLSAVLKAGYHGLLWAWNALAELVFLIQSFRALRGFHLLIVPGSGILIDAFGGPWSHPYTLYKWSLLAKLSGAKVAFLSVGSGPIHSPLSRFFIRRSLSWASFRSFREKHAQELAEAIGAAGPHPQCPDLAFSLSTPLPLSAIPTPPGGGVVGINAMPFPFFPSHDSPETTRRRYEAYLAALASFGKWLLDSGHTILLLPTQLRGDPPVLSDLRCRLSRLAGPAAAPRILKPPIATLDALLSAISMVDVVVATRYHAVVLSYLMHKPVLGISYHQKTDELMRDLGQADYLLDVSRLDSQKLIGRFQGLQANRTRVREQLFWRISEYGRALEQQYDQILGLVGEPQYPWTASRR